MRKVTILIAEDHPILRKTLLRTLNSISEFSCIEACDGVQALELVEKNCIDILLMDINMPKLSGIQVAQTILDKNLYKSPKIIILSVYNDVTLIHNLLQLGVRAYLTKEIEIDELIKAIHFVQKGGVYYQKRYEEELKEIAKSQEIPSIDLSTIEQEIVRQLAEGKTSEMIADAMGYSRRTIESKRLAIEKKTLSKNACELVNFAYKNGFLTIEN